MEERIGTRILERIKIDAMTYLSNMSMVPFFDRQGT
jgi:hypothetical protein